MTKGAFAAVLLFLLTSSLASSSVTAPSEIEADRTPFQQIRISSNADFTPENGVSSGTGTSGDPYMIEGLEIDGLGSTTCIQIINTTSHVVIRDVLAKNGSFGVKLQEVENVRVDSCVIEDQTVGIRVAYSDKSAIVDNTISRCEYGVYVVYSEGVRVDDNTFVDNDTNIHEEALPWELGRLGTYVCIALMIPLALVLGLLIWMRLGPPGKGGIRPPVE
jgi:parallel beta-helix repeat protein